MTLEVGSFEAKTHLPKLLKKAAGGETIIITNRGKPLAQLGPCTETGGKDRRRRMEEAIAGMRKLRETIRKRRIRLDLPPLTPKDIKAMTEEGRR